METRFFVCDGCGAKCDENDTYCKACSHTLRHSELFDEPVIDGIENAELKCYIGKNAAYYLGKFAKNKSRWCVQLNVAALLFGPVWFFYRKMYKFALLYVAVLLAVFALLNVFVPMLFQADIDRYYSARSAYLEYIESGRETYGEVDGTFGKFPAFREVYDPWETAKNDIKRVNFWISAVSFVINFAFRFFANSFYKNHIVSHIEAGNGGTSTWSAIGGYVLINASLAVITLLICQIPVVLQFAEATLGWPYT